MGRACTVCNHPDVADIDAALVSKAPVKGNLDERYGVTHSALRRHKEAHVSPALVAVARRREAEHDESLLDRIEGLITRTESLLDQAEAGGSVAQALSAVREVRGLLELLGRASGQLRADGPTTTINIATSSEWLTIRSALFAALATYPEARAAVAGRLVELEAAP